MRCRPSPDPSNHTTSNHTSKVLTYWERQLQYLANDAYASFLLFDFISTNLYQTLPTAAEFRVIYWEKPFGIRLSVATLRDGKEKLSVLEEDELPPWPLRADDELTRCGVSTSSGIKMYVGGRTGGGGGDGAGMEGGAGERGGGHARHLLSHPLLQAQRSSVDI